MFIQKKRRVTFFCSVDNVRKHFLNYVDHENKSTVSGGCKGGGRPPSPRCQYSGFTTEHFFFVLFLVVNKQKFSNY